MARGALKLYRKFFPHKVNKSVERKPSFFVQCLVNVLTLKAKVL